MKINLKMNGLNRLKKGDEISCLGIIVQGRVQIQRGGMLRIAQKGDLIGIFDSLISEYPASAIVLEDTFLYAFSVSPASSGRRPYILRKKEHWGLFLKVIRITGELQFTLRHWSWLISLKKERNFFKQRQISGIN